MQDWLKKCHLLWVTALLKISVIVLCGLFLIACSRGVYHTVQPGQTLYRISRTYGVEEAAIARVNRISDPTRVRAGTRILIPGATRIRYVPVVKSGAVVSTVKPTPSRPQKPSPPVKPVVKPKHKTTKKTEVVKVVKKKKAAPSVVHSTKVKRLHWPLRGKVVRLFSAKSQAGSGKGIEIAVRAGSRIQAAEAGKVIYSGDGVNGYGYLIILQHENDLFTVYGFNQKNFVRQGDFVSQGEKIALSGVPPSGGAARLHFEVREGKKAVDPILYLP